MPKVQPFTLTPAAVRHLAADFAEIATWIGFYPCGLRVSIYYVHGDGSRQYKTEPVSEKGIDPDDMRLDFPDGPVAVFVPRESYMRLWGHVLDVSPTVNDPEGRLGFWFRTADEA